MLKLKDLKRKTKAKAARKEQKKAQVAKNAVRAKAMSGRKMEIGRNSTILTEKLILMRKLSEELNVLSQCIGEVAECMNEVRDTANKLITASTGLCKECVDETTKE